MRQIVLDTETTGLEPELGHRIIEIGGVEVINRRLTGRHFHKYINPDRDIDDGALEVHGITREFLADKPRFSDVVNEFMSFVDGAELVIHNAPFDVSFLNAELAQLGRERVDRRCSVVDSLAMAKRKHPGQKNGLDALCRRYEVDNSARQLHGALLDAEILADVFLLMTGGQTALFGTAGENSGRETVVEHARLDANRPPLVVITATAAEREAHELILDLVQDSSGGPAAWRDLEFG